MSNNNILHYITEEFKIQSPPKKFLNGTLEILNLTGFISGRVFLINQILKRSIFLA